MVPLIDQSAQWHSAYTLVTASKQSDVWKG